ncbi:hypothetical protein AYO44_00320 [Planctomycetaceae bacterium SCGC AG-212-F19]|nr:hypothetical protein AYO44_00320 [Planctomycetaceae bacterium SCGC AG-212-F19]
MALLPPVCVCCGAAAMEFREVTLAMTPGSSFDTFLTSLPEFLQHFILEAITPIVVAIVTLRSGEMTRCTVRLPVCARHRHHWLWHRWILCTVGTLALGSLLGSLIFLDGDALTAWLLVSAAGVILWLTVLAWQRRCMVHAIDGSRSTVVLAGVHPEFVDAARAQSGWAEVANDPG